MPITVHAPYAQGDRVLLTHNNYDLTTDKYIGKVREVGKVIRIWPNGLDMTIRVAGKSTYVRRMTSPHVRKD